MVENKVVCELRNGSFNQLRKFLKFENLKYCEKWIMRNLNNWENEVREFFGEEKLKKRNFNYNENGCHKKSGIIINVL